MNNIIIVFTCSLAILMFLTQCKPSSFDYHNQLFGQTLEAGFSQRSWMFFVPPSPNEQSNGEKWTYRGTPLVFSDSVHKKIKMENYISDFGFDDWQINDEPKLFNVLNTTKKIDEMNIEFVNIDTISWGLYERELEDLGKTGVYFFLEPVEFKHISEKYILTGIRWHKVNEVYLWKQTGAKFDLIENIRYRK